MAFTTNTLSEQLAHEYIAARLDEALSHRTALQSARRGGIRRSRTVPTDLYTDSLTARGETIR